MSTIRVRLLDRIQPLLRRENFERARPWLAVCGLWVLFEAPTIIRSGGVSLSRVRPSGDVLVLLTLAALSGRFAGTRFVRALLITYAALLIVIRLDYVVFMLLMRDEPLLYDQLLMLRHLFVLISDLWNFKIAAVTACITAVVLGFPWLIGRLLQVARPLLAPDRVEQTMRTGYAVWLVVLALSGMHAVGLTKYPIVNWVSPTFARNVAESVRTYQAISRGIHKPAYRELTQIQLPADKRPDVYLFLVESYGRLMFTDPGLKPTHLSRLADIQARLEAKGWSSASAWSRATVSGGRSWMAEASILLGTPVSHEAVFQHLIANAQKLPHLVSFMDAQGYQTILLAASDRERPGIKAANPYRYQHYLDFPSVHYTGRAYGWGIVPDQYSLGFASERFLDKATRPVFLNFHLVTSHAPWQALPPLVEDWHSLNAERGSIPSDDKPGSTVVLRSLRRYARGGAQSAWHMGGLTAGLRDAYGSAIDYELALITSFLATRERNAIVIVMGDHQPPVIPKSGAEFDVPVHVFARDPHLLAEFRTQGYAAGLLPNQVVSSHAGLLSLIARTLVRQAGGIKLPPFRPEGVPLLEETGRIATTGL